MEPSELTPHANNIMKEVNSTEPPPISENEFVTRTEMEEFVTPWFQILGDILRDGHSAQPQEVVVRPDSQSPNNYPSCNGYNAASLQESVSRNETHESSQPTTSTGSSDITPEQYHKIAYFMNHGFTYENAMNLLPLIENENPYSYELHRQHWDAWYEWTQRPKNHHVHPFECSPQEFLAYLKDRLSSGSKPIRLYTNWKRVLEVVKHSGKPYEAFKHTSIEKFLNKILNSEHSSESESD